MNLLDKMLHAGEGRIIKRLKAIADQVTDLEPDFEAMDDDELRSQTAEYKQRYENGESLDDLLPESFATVREATRRVLGKRPYDVQLMGGAALHGGQLVGGKNHLGGNIAEMKTGEGKTIVALMPSYLNALSGKGVHIVTVNDYLAETQSEQMGRVHHFLGLKTGVVLSHLDPQTRRDAYLADITYGTNNEFGFDYLRDNMAVSLSDCVQRGHNYAIVDEIDSILIDEARTPLIISGIADENQAWYPTFAKIARQMQRDRDYEVDEKKRTVSILDHGITLTEDRLGIENLYESANTPLISYLNNAIRAKELFKRDKDYVLLDGEVLIVDEHTGRTLAGRRYSEGLHQALEAKEGVEIKDEFQTQATITLQNYFRMYDKLAGMTGTAKTEEAEFQRIYGLSVLPIPTNKPMIRVDQRDIIYRTEDAKFAAIVEDVAERYEEGQPVLLGTASVAKSEKLSALLKKAKVPHQVLNAKYHEQEAGIVAMAGKKGTVTVSTNMAGRGTDIMLGGNHEFLADAKLREMGLDPVENTEEYDAAWPGMLAEMEEACAAEHDEVVELGGLYVVGTERHESRRIDNQLRGRSGRQGDPGESRFYLSLEDELMRLFQSDLVDRMFSMLNIPDDMPIEDKMVTRAIERAQKGAEGQNAEIRKNILKYDDVMNRQRHAIYADRRQILEGNDVEMQMRENASNVVEALVRDRTSERFAEDWDFEQLWQDMQVLYPVSLDLKEFEGTDVSQDELVAEFVDDVQDAYDKREESLGEETMRELERRVMLTVMDRKWREHLYEMDYLREGIGLRAMAQRDPLVEYKREGALMYDAMRAAFKEEIVGYLFNLEVQVEPVEPQIGVQMTPDQLSEAVEPAPAAESTPEPAPKVKAKGLAEKPREPRTLNYSAPSETGGAVTTAKVEKDAFDGTPRNAPCPCGSGKKYKMCHGRK